MRFIEEDYMSKIWFSLWHIPVSATLMFCLVWAQAVYMPLWIAVILALLVTIGIGAWYEYNEYTGNRSETDMVFNILGASIGGVAVPLTQAHWGWHAHVGHVGVLGVMFVLLCGAGLVQKFRK